MGDNHKTKAQLIRELDQARRRMAELEAGAGGWEQALAAQKELAAVAEKRRRWNEKLGRAGMILAGTLNYEKVLDEILEQLRQVLPHDAAWLMLVEGQKARIFRWHGYTRFSPVPAFARHTFPIDDVPLLKILKETREPFLGGPEAGENRLLGDLHLAWVKSHLSTAVFLRNELIGFLHLDSAAPDFFGPPEAGRLLLFASYAAIALKNGQLYDQARREIFQRVGALKKERNFVSAVLDTAGALVMVLNRPGRILRFNRACERTTGYRFEEVRGQLFWDLFLAGEEAQPVLAAFNALQSGAQLANGYESYWRTREGERRLIVWSNAVLLDPQQNVEYIISTGSDITEHRQLEERLLAIHRLGRRLNLLRDETDILDIAMETAAAQLPFESAGSGLFDDVRGRLAYRFHPDSTLAEALELDLPLAEAARTGQLARWSRPGEAAPALEWLTIPVNFGDYTMGVFDIARASPASFTAADRQLLQTLADQTAVALENARLHQKARQRVAELATMNVVGQALSSSLDLPEILGTLMDHAMRLLEAMAASVVIHDVDRDDLWFTTASGRMSDRVQGQRLALGQGIVGWVIQHGEPALVPDVSQDPRFFEGLDRQTGFNTRSVICVPLKTAERVIGAIEVMNKQRENDVFLAEDLRLLSWLAAPAAIAIENARLFAQVRLGREQLRSLSRRLVEAQEKERHHIARELHDEAGQALTSLMFGLRLLEREAGDPAAVTTRAGELKAITSDVSQYLHNLAVTLRPASLDHLGLVAALRQYVEQFSQKHDLSVQFEAVGLDHRRLEPAVETNLYRIIQEALTNVARHARAGRVDVLLEQRHDRLLIILEDDGIGFEPDLTGQKGRLGLLGMRERTEMLGGRLVIESIPGTGTTVYVEIPYDHSHFNR